MEFLLSQICGLIVAVAVIISSQLKNIRHILACQLICNGVGAISYIFVGGLSGCGIYLVAALQSVVYFLFRLKDKEAPYAMAVCFVCAYLVCSFTTYKSPVDIIAAIAALMCAIGLIQTKPSLYRIMLLSNAVLWIAYDINVGAYTMIVSHVITAVSSLVGIIRLDIKWESVFKLNSRD